MFRQMWAYDVIDRLGVATHVRYSDGAYRDHDRTIDRVRYLGLRHLRDSAPRAASTLPYRRYVDAGLRFCLSCSPIGAAREDAGAAAEVFDRILDRFPDGQGLVGLEGPNEPNNQPIRFGGVSDTKRSFEAARAYMTALYAAKANISALAGVPLAGVSNTPRLPVASDLDNEHVYPPKGAPPGPHLSGLAARRGRLIVTEFGYNTGRAAVHSGSVSEWVQAASVLGGMLSAAASGIERLYVYELFDEKPDPDHKIANLHWGLFRADGEPKPAAAAIRKLTGLLRPEPLAAAGGEVDLTVEAAPDTRALLVRRSAGEALVLLWRDAPIWDPVARLEISPPAAKVRLICRGAARSETFDLLRDETAGSASAGEHVEASLGPAPLAVRFTLA